jgi:hypothetical protein
MPTNPFISGIFSVSFFVLCALVLSIVALVYALKASNDNTDFEGFIPFAAGLMTGAGVGVGTGVNLAAFGFGNYAVGDGVIEASTIVRSMAFVAPYNGTLKNLRANFSASANGLTGAAANFEVRVFVSPKASCGPVCYAAQIPSNLYACTLLASDDAADYCIKKCNPKCEVKVKCGDLITVVARAGSADDDLALLYAFSGSLQLEKC